MGNSTSHKLSRITHALLTRAIAFSTLLLLGSCSSTEDRLINAFIESNPVAEPDDARCVVDELLSSYGADGVAAELEADAPTSEFLDSQGRAMAKCGVVVNTKADLVEAFMRANPDASNSEASCVIDSLTEALGATELIATLWQDPIPRDFELAQFRASFECGIDSEIRSELTAQLVDQGTPADKAPCVADAIVDEMNPAELNVLITGEITDAFYTKYFNAMQTCGALDN